MPTCSIHNIPKKQKHNSTLYYCPQCLIEQNKAMLKRSFVKQTKSKPTKKNQLSIKQLNKRLDSLWSLLVKLRAGNKCEYCGTSKTLNSHHIFSRSNISVRWDEINGICLCASHHVLSSSFSAHKTPIEFVDWLKKYKGEPFIDTLRIKANTAVKLSYSDKLILMDYFKNCIKKYK